MRRLAVILAITILTATAQALPPDRLIQLTPGSDRFEKAPQGTWQAISSDPEVVTARYFDTAEVFLQAHKKGTALVLLANFQLGQVWVWKVKVEESREVAMPDPKFLQKACGCGKGKLEFPVTCRVENATCLSKLRKVLRNTDLTQKYLRVRFSVEGLQVLLKDLEASLKNQGHQGVSLAFSGVNLRISGKLPNQSAWHRLILDIYREMVGKLVIDNRVELKVK